MVVVQPLNLLQQLVSFTSAISTSVIPVVWSEEAPTGSTTVPDNLAGTQAGLYIASNGVLRACNKGAEVLLLSTPQGSLLEIHADTFAPTFAIKY